MNRWKSIKKTLKPHRIILLIILLTSNSFAWFIYATKVQNQMSAHVSAWEVDITDNDKPVVDYVDIFIDNMYPGMSDFHYELKIVNRGEMTATVTYSILEANLIGSIYITKEGRAEKKEEIQETDLSSEELIQKLLNEYPYSFSFDLSNTTVDAQGGETMYIINTVWPFESGNDEEDTAWGIKASNYKKENPDKPSISLKIKINITQIN